MGRSKRVVLIAFYDKVCVSMRALSSVLREAGHRPYLVYFKDDRTIIRHSRKKNNKYYQVIVNNNFVGCGEDVNPPTEQEFKLLVSKVSEIAPDIIGISARSVAKDLTRRVVTELRKTLPNAIYIGGGYGPTIEPKAFLESLDFVCLGEGERTILELCTLEEPRQVANLAWLEGGKLRHNGLSQPVPIDESIYPDWDFEDKYYIDDEKIIPMKNAYDTKTYDIFASRGCPAHCSYCMACQWKEMYKMYGGNIPKLRLRSVECVIDELMIAKKKYDMQYVRFMDSIFGFNKRWLFNFLDIYDKKIGLKFFCYLDERFHDEESIKRLKASGIKFTTVGIQSATERIRYDIMRRNVTDDDLVQYAETLINNGIAIKYDILGWNPFETNESLRQGIGFLKRLPKGEETVVFQLTMFPGSPIYTMFKSIRPRGLTDKEYEYWAWIYQMIMRSKETEKIADFALNYEYFKEHPRILKELFNEALGRTEMRYRIFAARDIKKGEVVTRVMYDQMKSDEGDGIPYDEARKILSKPVRRDVRKGNILRWEDFFGTYQDVGGGSGKWKK